MAVAELTTATATGLAALVASRAASAREVVDAHLRRVEEVNGAINAVVALDAELALAAAGRADTALARGEPTGPLHGVPFTVKDNIAAAGLPMAIGAPERAGVVPDGDATVVARMRAGGAILLGKTNCPPWGGGIETANPVYGRTSNPYDLARTPGGSSGGEAAIVAAAGSACGLGTDSGASIRLPAHFCGLAALKPSAGRVPLTGVLDDEGQLGALGDPRTQVGPLGRSVADVALALRTVAGPDGRDAAVVPVRRGDPAAVTLRGLRVAVHTRADPAVADADTAAVVARAADALRAAGAVVEEAETGRRARLDDRGLALLRRRAALRRALPAAAPLGRLSLRHARVRRALRRPPRAGVPRPGPSARHDERRRRGRPDRLHHAVQPQRLARGDRPLRHVAGGTADRRAGRGRAVAGRRRPGRGRATRGRPRRVPPAAALISPRTSSGRTARPRRRPRWSAARRRWPHGRVRRRP